MHLNHKSALMIQKAKEQSTPLKENLHHIVVKAEEGAEAQGISILVNPIFNVIIRKTIKIISLSVGQKDLI